MADDERVLGVDGCKAGWIGILLAGSRTAAYFAPDIEELVGLAEADGPVGVVGIDIPIGLPDHGRRKADEQARKTLGALWSSVFVTPVREAFEAATHAEATKRNRRLANEGVSIQAYGLKPKVLQVDSWVRRCGRRVVEVHPEVSFARLAGGPLVVRKRTWAGVELRRRLLAQAGVTLAGDLGAAGRAAAVDDVLDAAAAAWTARRVLRGEARCRPDPPQKFSDGLECAIWT